MTRNQQISILGCGWLGLPLAQELIKKGFKVNGSTTSEAKVKLLEELGVNPFLIDVDCIDKELLNGFLEGSEVLVVAIPPRRKKSDAFDFVEVVKKLLSLITNDVKVLLVSSTSVYPNTNNWVTEEMDLLPDTQRGKLMYKIENLFLNKFKEGLTIIRMAGLIGPNRNPGKFLAGKTNLPNGSAPVNLIHQFDAVALLLKIIETCYWGEVVNGVNSDHPSRKEYYTKVSKVLNLELPVFLEDSEIEYKLVSNKKAKCNLGYDSYKSLFDN